MRIIWDFWNVNIIKCSHDYSGVNSIMGTCECWTTKYFPVYSVCVVVI